MSMKTAFAPTAKKDHNIALSRLSFENLSKQAPYIVHINPKIAQIEALNKNKYNNLSI